jgi:hypothetical protein
LLKYLGLADLLVPAQMRDEVADILVKAIKDNGGKPLTQKQVESLKIKELSSELTFEEKEELRSMKDFFLKQDLIPILYAYGRRQAEIFFSGDSKIYAQRIARRVANNSFHAACVSEWLISRGFDEFLKGISLDELAQYELENYLELTFQSSIRMPWKV